MGHAWSTKKKIQGVQKGLIGRLRLCYSKNGFRVILFQQLESGGAGVIFTNFGLFRRRFAFVLFLAASPQALMADVCPSRLAQVAGAGPSERSTRAFSLVELGVVVVVIGTLVALTLPGLAAARRSARETKCLSNLKQAHAVLMVYENDYKVLPVHYYTTNLPPGQNHAGVNLSDAIEINSGIRKAFECPEDKGFTPPNSDAVIYHSYLYRGLEAMMLPNSPWGFNPRQARVRYEREQFRPLWQRLPLWHDVYGFHQSKRGPQYYEDGKRNAVWYDGQAARIPSPPPAP